MTNYFDLMTLDLPEGEADGLAVQRFEVTRYDLNNLREALRTGRQTKPGRYTKLVDHKNGDFWMSDTDAEKWDHLPAVRAIEVHEAKRILINGLGLGMVLKAALSFDHVERIDVVEMDARVIDLVGPHYLTDDRVNIIHANAWTQMKRWPRGTRWDVGWSDIWPDICTDNRDEMQRMNAFYRRRCTWHHCWAQPEVTRMYRAERAEERRHADFMS